VASGYAYLSNMCWDLVPDAVGVYCSCRGKPELIWPCALRSLGVSWWREEDPEICWQTAKAVCWARPGPGIIITGENVYRQMVHDTKAKALG
jgi:hypothetical protein